LQKFLVSISQEIEADTAEEAALLLYQALTQQPAPLRYSVANGGRAETSVTLDRDKADAFASIDHTADPGNW
jgi:hypothetical protein